MMREVDRIPDWLVTGLVEGDKEDSDGEQKQGGPEGLWQRVDSGGQPVIVRSANKQKPGESIPIRRVQ